MEPWKLGMVGKRWPVYEGMGASGKGVFRVDCDLKKKEKEVIMRITVFRLPHPHIETYY